MVVVEVEVVEGECCGRGKTGAAVSGSRAEVNDDGEKKRGRRLTEGEAETECNRGKGRQRGGEATYVR